MELKTSNYSLEEQNRRNGHEISSLRVRNEELEKQLSRAQTVAKLNPLSFARNIANKVDNKLRDRELDQLVNENESLVRKIESQEQEFKVTNETLKSEITSLMTINEKLQNELKLFQNNSYVESHPECDLGVNVEVISDQNITINDIEDNNNCQTFQMPINKTFDQQNDSVSQLSFAILAEKEKLETKVNELQELVESLRKENELISAQVEELQIKCEKSDQMQTELDDCNNLIERQNSLIEEMRVHKNELELKFKSDCDKLRAENNTKVELLDSKLKSVNETNERLENNLKELTNKLHELENVNKENEKLHNEVDSYKEELSFCKTQYEETIERIERENNDKFDELLSKHESEVSQIRQECDDYKNRISELETENKRLNQQILDGVEDRKIHEKKGVAMVKELKRQLHSERRRAEKLQEKLQEVLNESTTSTFSNDIQRKQSTSCNGNNNGNDSSSVGSWSFMSAKDTSATNRTSSMHSGSDGRESTPPYSPSAANDSSVIEKNASLLERENTELVTRITSLQQEKWLLEEKINQLELSHKALAEDIVHKTEIIQYYCMEGRSDRPNPNQSMLHSSDKLTVKRVVDFIKDKGDENMREINRKVQRMLEETLTKNMHLQQNLETLSNEVVRLNKLIELKSNPNLSTAD